MVNYDLVRACKTVDLLMKMKKACFHGDGENLGSGPVRPAGADKSVLYADLQKSLHQAYTCLTDVRQSLGKLTGPPDQAYELLSVQRAYIVGLA